MSYPGPGLVKVMITSMAFHSRKIAVNGNNACCVCHVVEDSLMATSCGGQR